MPDRANVISRTRRYAEPARSAGDWGTNSMKYPHRYPGTLHERVELVLLRKECQGIDLSHAVFDDEANLTGRDLRSAILSDATLEGADLRRARLDRAWIIAAHLREAHLGNCSLRHARVTASDLRYADLRLVDADSADLGSVDLTGANLSGAQLTNADLFDARFIHTLFDGDNGLAVVDGARLGQTIFVGTQLAPFCRASRLRHNAPSSVDFGSILRSLDEPGLRAFLLDTGLPDVAVEYNMDCARAVRADPLFSFMQSTFISYVTDRPNRDADVFGACHRGGAAVSRAWPRRRLA